MSRQLIQKIKAMLSCIEYGILFVDTVDMKIKAHIAFNAMFVDTVDTVALTQHLIQSTIRCENCIDSVDIDSMNALEILVLY